MSWERGGGVEGGRDEEPSACGGPIKHPGESGSPVDHRNREVTKKISVDMYDIATEERKGKNSTGCIQ